MLATGVSIFPFFFFFFDQNPFWVQNILNAFNIMGVEMIKNNRHKLYIIAFITNSKIGGAGVVVDGFVVGTPPGRVFKKCVVIRSGRDFGVLASRPIWKLNPCPVLEKSRRKCLPPHFPFPFWRSI